MANRIKGMYDILPEEGRIWRKIEDTFLNIGQKYGFAEVRTPIVEKTELFSRSIGESTDIIEKEMYTFDDRKGKKLSLRPEGTASMVRSYVQNKIASVDPIAKWVYRGPMYRYERPQKGRNRQFFQLGAEVFGIASPEQDAELIAMAMEYFDELGLENVKLELNSLGNADERKAYREKLIDYLSGYKDKLCKDCLRRLEVNPLRTLDCKVPDCIEVAKDAPLMLDNLEDESRIHFEKVCNSLELLGVKYEINKRIVRGLDYYNRTAFEFKAEGLGAQDAIGGGGRYDTLVKSLGGPHTPAVGFALGLERIAIALENEQLVDSTMDFYFVPMGEAAILKGQEIVKKLRSEGAIGEIDYSGRRLKHLFARAERLNARNVIMLGDNELEKNVVIIKNMSTKEQNEITIDVMGKKRANIAKHLGILKTKIGTNYGKTV